jgi:hypothetical protein
MVENLFESKPHRITAAAVAIAYCAVQTFQWYAFSHMPSTSDPAQELLQGAEPINIARAILMLFSFFGLIYLFLVCCGTTFRRRPTLSILSLLGFFTFCVLEIQLRSVELFYIFLRLPAHYHAATDAASQAWLLRIPAVFADVQSALYFPLGLSWLFGSVLLCFALGGRRFDWLARLAFGLNAVRLALRMLDVYVVGPRFDTLYSDLYLPLVLMTFAPMAAWLLLHEPAGGWSSSRRPLQRAAGGGSPAVNGKGAR